MLKNLLSSLTKSDKFFALIWLLMLLWGVLIFLSVFSGSFESRQQKEIVKGLENHPAVVEQIAELKRSGLSSAVIQKQLQQAAVSQSTVFASLRAKAALLGTAALLFAGIVILYLRAKKDLNQEKRRWLLGALIALLVLQGLYTATRYIEPDPRDLSCPDGIKKLQKLDPLFRVHAPNKALYNPWISEYFPLYNIPTIDVPADSRPSLWRKLFFYDRNFDIARKVLYTNVRYVLCSPQELGLLKSMGLPLDNIGSFSVQGQRQVIGEYKNALPRFYAPQSAKLVADAEEALSLMNDPKTDPRAVCLLQMGEPREKGEGTNIVSLVNFEPEKVELSCDFAFPGYVCLVCEPLPGWSAQIDGAKTDVVRCNLMQQAVPVPTGKHSVVFVFSKSDLSSKLCDISHVVILPLLALITLALCFIPKKHAEK